MWGFAVPDAVRVRCWTPAVGSPLFAVSGDPLAPRESRPHGLLVRVLIRRRMIASGSQAAQELPPTMNSTMTLANSSPACSCRKCPAPAMVVCA